MRAMTKLNLSANIREIPTNPYKVISMCQMTWRDGGSAAANR